MRELIDRQKAIDALKKQQAYFPKEDAPQIYYEYRRAIASVVMLPLVDAVEVVRCKDCFFHGDFDENGYCVCECNGSGMPMDGFCSDGERKE